MTHTVIVALIGTMSGAIVWFVFLMVEDVDWIAQLDWHSPWALVPITICTIIALLLKKDSKS